MSDVVGRRCANCGALASSEAEWCGQCFTTLLQPEPEPVASTHPGVDPDAPTKVATWPCPVCGDENALELDACAVCGTPFGALFKQDEKGKKVDPKDAMVASLVFPGLGHRMLGRSADALARGVLFGMTTTMTVVILFSGVKPGPLVGILLVYGGAAVAISGGSALDALRIAQGAGPFVSAGALLWATLGPLGASTV